MAELNDVVEMLEDINRTLGGWHDLKTKQWNEGIDSKVASIADELQNGISDTLVQIARALHELGANTEVLYKDGFDSDRVTRLIGSIDDRIGVTNKLVGWLVFITFASNIVAIGTLRNWF